MIIRIGICDDDIIFCHKIKLFLQKRDTYEYEVDKFSSGKELLEANKKIRYDVVFLDIEMPEMNGIETANRLRKQDSELIIIFLTNYQNYVKMGYLVQAFRYVSKCVPKELEEAVHSMELALQQKRLTEFRDYQGYVYVLRHSDIIYAETKERRVCVHYQGGEFQITGTLQKFQEQLADEGFYICHRSFIVNFNHVRSIGKDEIIMDNGTKVFLSRKKRNECSTMYFRWKFQRGNG